MGRSERMNWQNISLHLYIFFIVGYQIEWVIIPACDQNIDANVPRYQEIQRKPTCLIKDFPLTLTR